MAISFFKLRLLFGETYKLYVRRFSSAINTFTYRTHTCGELRNDHAGLEVTLCGWIQFQRFDKFALLKDCYGIVQVVFDEHDVRNKNFISSLPLESIVQVKGVTRKRPPNKINKKMPTGDIEVEAKEVKLLNLCIPKLPFTTRDYEKIGSTVAQKYRYLSLRMTKTQEILRTRFQFLMKVRDFLSKQYGFVEVETPTLFRRTPGGAKEFVVPTKFPGKFYSLVQSPQQFKQLLMVGSLDRYFQIARCYRNEGTKSDRQPEFTQIDIEASFTTAEDIRSLVEQMLESSWPTEKSKFFLPFPCLTYKDAMNLYGTDKPDIRYGMKIQNLTNYFANMNLNIFAQVFSEPDCLVAAIVVPNGSRFFKPPQIKKLQESSKLQFSQNLLDIHIKDDFIWNSALSKHLPNEFQSSINDVLEIKPNDLILIAAGKEKTVLKSLGEIRIECADYLHSTCGELYKTNLLSFLWVTDFPLFETDENGCVVSAHHPFTAPHPEDIDFIYTNPMKARSQHYDLVLNGQEVGGGSIRIHDSQLQKYILEEILKEDSNSLQHLLDALNSGCPPHGGIALGVDRLLAIMFGCQSISEVIAFPKSLDGKDLMAGSPSTISEEDKKYYHLEIKPPVN